MPTIGHLGVALPVNKVIMREKNTKKIVLFSLLCALLPDFDFIGFIWGLEYSHFFGHRGFTHSLFFSALVAFLIAIIFFKNQDGSRLNIRSRYFFLLFFNFFMVGASHNLLDMLTNGSLGVALLSPFWNGRVDFGMVLIDAMPLHPSYFISMGGPKILLQEFFYIVLPSLLLTMFLNKRFPTKKDNT